LSNIIFNSVIKLVFFKIKIQCVCYLCYMMAKIQYLQIKMGNKYR